MPLEVELTDRMFQPEFRFRSNANQRSTPQSRPSSDLFDYDFYLFRHGDEIPAGVDPLDDYLERGWKLGYDPSAKFSTNYYLERNPDVAEAGFNPLVHYVLYGKDEGRRPAQFVSTLKDHTHRPSVSVIIPVYNHATFLPQRLKSIIDQRYENMELIVLDDASTDDSVEVAVKLLSESDIAYRIIPNEKNSGGVFFQWEKGLKLAKGEIIWICESDDYCDPGFLRETLPLFADESIMLAFGDIQFCDVEGKRQEGLDGYRDSAEPGIWNTTLIRPAAEWFRKGFGVRNVIPNVGGCVFRNQALSDKEWSELRKYSVVGDWYFYLTIARGGMIAYEPAARAYFRQHGTNTSVRSFAGDRYYLEHQSIAESIASQWGVSKPSIALLETHLRAQYDMFYLSDGAPFEKLFSARRVATTPRRHMHVLMSMLGFYLGGGELFPIRLVNLLVRRGITVSMLVMQTASADKRVREKLDPRVAIYDAVLAEETGKNEFLVALSVDIVHSHNVAGETFFFRDRKRLKVPYVVTLHGSYEFATLDSALMKRISKGVQHWVYLTERNLQPLPPEVTCGGRKTKMPNAVEVQNNPLPFTRADLGIPESAFVFTVISRALKEKGWEETAIAFKRVTAKSKREMHLLFCGTGPEAETLEQRFASNNIHFLGFQSDPHGIYRISDCGVLASRFGGESFPLTIVEALQVGRPVICTDVGECRNIIASTRGDAGLMIDPVSDDKKFIAKLADAMQAMVTPEMHKKLSRRAHQKRNDFDPEKMADDYTSLYDAIIKADRLA